MNDHFEEKKNETFEQDKKINDIKEFWLFNIIHEMNSENNEEKKFETSLKDLNSFGDFIKNKNCINELDNNENKKYKKIVEIIQEKLSGNENCEDKAKEFIEKFQNIFEIKDKELIEDLYILFKKEKIELDIKEIIFFFDNFEKNNKEWNNQFSIKNNNKNFLNFKKKLEELKKRNIYSYKNISDYNRIFSCLYDKKEAMDFLFEKIGENIIYLKERIEPIFS